MKSNLYKKDLISTKFAGELSGYTSRYLRRLAHSGEIEGVQVGRVWLIKRGSLIRFLDAQTKRKRELSLTRSRVHAAEYHSKQHAESVLTKPLSVPQEIKLTESTFLSEVPMRKSRATAFALSIAVFVLVFGALAAQATVIPQLAHHVATIASEIAFGFNETFGDIPSHFVARVDSAAADIHAGNAQEAARLARTSVSLMTPVLMHPDIKMALLTSVVGLRVPHTASSPLIAEGKANMRGLRFVAIDTLAFISSPPQIVNALGTTIIDATHALIHADVAISYSLAAAAPASSRATVALVGSVGDLLALATEHATVEAPARIALALRSLSEAGPALAQAVFNAEYAGATHFVALSRIVSGQYLALIQGTGRLAYVGAKGTRDGIDATGPLLAHTPLAFEDAYLGVLGKSALALNAVTQVPQVAAALSAVAPALSVGEQLALATYESIHTFFDSMTSALALLFAPSPTIIVVNNTPKLPVIVATSSLPVATTSTPRIAVTTYPTYNSYPTYTTVVQGISPDFMNQSLATLRTDILSTVALMVQPVATQTSLNITNMYSESHPVVFTGLPLVSATVGNFGSLSAGVTTLGDTTVSGSLGLSGSLSSDTSAIAPYFIATSSTATSTFAGSLAVGTSSPFGNALLTVGTDSPYLYVSSNTGHIGIGTSSPDALLSLSQPADGTPIISAYRAPIALGDFISYKASDGTILFRVDNSGNLLAGGIVNSGSQTITSTSQPQFRLQYNSSNELTFSTGSTGTTTLTVNGSSPGLVFAPQPSKDLVNMFNFTDSASNSILSIDTLNQRVGIGTTSPSQTLSVQGNSYVSGTSFFGGAITSTSTITSGAINKVTITAPATGSTLTIADGKTLTVSDSTTLGTNSITFAGTESLTLAAAKSVSFADTFATSGAFPLTLTTSASTNVTLPTTGTLATLAGAEALSNKTITASSFNGTTVIASGAITSGLINGQTISSAASFTGTLAATGAITGSQFNGSGAGLMGTGASFTSGAANSVTFNSGLTTGSVPTFAGLTLTGDITTYRSASPTTGVIYLGSNAGTRYLYYNGTSYFLSGAGLDIGGTLSISGTSVVDASRNLVNIGTITSGLINGQTISSAANFTGTLAVAGTLTTKTPPLVTAITGATSGAIEIPEVSVGAVPGFVTALHQTTLYTGGYRQHLSLGDYRTASTWGGGFFVGLGGNDSYPTEYYLMGYGGTISHSSGTVNVIGNVSGTASSANAVSFNGGLTTGSSPTFAGLTLNNTANITGSVAVNAQNDITTLNGIITLYGTGNQTTSQIMFKNTSGLGFGNHGAITGGYNTYFVMDTSDRGWIFRNASTATNVASISNTGVIAATTFWGALTGHASSDLALTGGTISGVLNIANGDSSYTYYGPNASWGGSLYVGASPGKSTTNTASVVATDGNLHLDSGTNGKAVYVQYYSQQNTYINPNGGNVGIGTVGPLSKLSVGGVGIANAGVYGTGTYYGVYGDSASGYGVYGTGSYGVEGVGTVYGVVGTGTSFGVYGNGGSYGVYGAYGTIAGVYGVAKYTGILGASGIGVSGVAGAYDGTIGVSGSNSDSTAGSYGVYCSSGQANGCGGNRAWYNASDARLKKDIVTIPNALDTVMHLRGVNFNWIDGGGADTGLIAQETLPYFPQVVGQDATTGMYGMRTGSLTGLLIEAVKDVNLNTIGLTTANASTSTTPSIFITPAGNVGVGTPTPQHTLDVAGDIGAISFVNTSTRDLKTDISYATASSTDQMLNELVNLRVATYRYKIEDQSDPLRIGLIAEDTATIAPEILSPDGKGVDLYKLATFNIAATQALAAKFDVMNTRMTSLEARMTALESGAVSSASGSPMISIASSTEQITGWFASAGNGIGDLFAKTFHASEKICVDDQCLTKDDVKALLALEHAQMAGVAGSLTTTTPTTGISITPVATSTASGVEATSTDTTPIPTDATATTTEIAAPITITSVASTTDTMTP